MKLVIFNFTQGNLSGGYNKYLNELVPLLASHDSVSKLLVMLPSSCNFEIGGEKIEVCRFNPLAAQFIPYKLRKFIRLWGADVIFIPTARYFRVRGIPSVVMVRNMEVFTSPAGKNSVYVAIKNLFRLKYAVASIKGADRVIAVSQFVKNEILKSIGVDCDKIGVVYHGVHRHDSAHERKIDWNFSKGLPHQYILAVGSIRSYRGLEDVILAYKELCSDFPNLKLLIAGSPDPDTIGYFRRLKNFEKELQLETPVDWLGQLAENKLIPLYNQCACFIMTSRVEACPNTVLESLAAGCLAISVTNEPMPEFYRDCASYYSAGDSEELSSKLTRVLRLNIKESNKIKKRTEARAEMFSWGKCADRTMNQLQRAIAEKDRLL